MKRLPGAAAPIFAGLALALPASALAQSIGYDDVSGADSGPTGAPQEAAVSARTSGGARVEVRPYIEVGQVAGAELSPGDEVFTYSRLAAGVDGVIAGRNNAASLSLRYERRIAWDDDTSDGDEISGIANGYATVVPGVQIHAGGLATRTRIENSGASVQNTLVEDDQVTQIYSVYAGPSVATYAGDVALSANYRVGYTKVEQSEAFIDSADVPDVDVFDDSVVHVANVQAALAPRTVLPVGVGVGGSYYREDISNLDQRVEDMQASVSVTVPVGLSVQVVGSVGYESVEISARDAVRDADGNPVVGPDGRYVTDKSQPRILAYDVDGLIWDVGVMWKPSRRTNLTAHVGRRYGATSVSGTFSYVPDQRSSLNILVYDNVAGFGGQVNRLLADLPDDFEAIRDPLSGNLSGCVSSLDEGACLSGALGSIRSSTFRARGIAASYGMRFGPYEAGVGAGYDRRKFIAAPGTVLAVSNGIIDENYWLAGYFNGRIDRSSSFSTNLYANWIDSGRSLSGDVTAMGATAAYYRNFTDHLTGTAALGIDGLTRDDDLLEDLWTASALLGLRYNF